MVGAHIQLRLLPTSLLDIHKVMMVLVCCLKGIWVHPNIVPPAELVPDFGILGPLWSGNMMVKDDISLRLLPTSIMDTFKVFKVLECCLKGIWVHPHIVPPAKMAHVICILGHLRHGNDATTLKLRLISTSDYFPHPNYINNDLLSHRHMGAP